MLTYMFPDKGPVTGPSVYRPFHSNFKPSCVTYFGQGNSKLELEKALESFFSHP